MVTIKDIAKHAGVSHGTVSNVINKNNNVSAEKIILVENAIRELGYNINTQASQLRAQNSKKIIIILPRIPNERYMDFYKGVAYVASKSFLDVEIIYTNNEANVLKKAKETKPIAIIVIANIDNEIDSSTNLDDVYFFERKSYNNSFISFDFSKAGVDIASKCLEAGHKNILISYKKDTCNQEFLKEIKNIFDKENIAYSLLPYLETHEFQNAFEIATSENKFDAIISQNSEVSKYLNDLSKYNVHNKNAKFYTIENTSILPTYKNEVYQMDYSYAGNEVARMIIENTDIEEDVFLENKGFYENYIPESAKNGKTIRVLMLSSPTSETLKKLLPQFTKATGIDVKFISLGYDEIYREALENVDSNIYDIIRLDIVMSHSISHRIFKEFDTFHGQEIIDKIYEKLPNEYFKVKGKTYTVPFDPSSQILYYRKDLFQDTLIKRKYYEKYKTQLEPPTNFKDFKQVSEFFTKKYNKSSQTEFGTNLVYGTNMVAASEFLPRLMYNKGIIIKKDNISLNKDIFIKTMQEYLDMLKFSDKESDEWWKKSLDKLIDGKIAMCTVYSNHASNLSKDLEVSDRYKLGNCNVPNNKPMLGGGVLGITNNTEHLEECIEFLKWVYSDEVSNICAYMGGFICTKSVFDNKKIKEMYPWVENLNESFETGERLFKNPDLKIECYEFEKVIGKSARLVMENIISLEEGYEIAKKYLDMAQDRKI